MATVPQARAAAESLTAETTPIVVKLGGSVVRSPELRPWLDAIAASPRPVVVVPGGGALADEVRSCQAALGFGNAAAHRMALLAMDQLAWAVAGLRQGFEVGDTEPALKRILAEGKVALWAPFALVSNRHNIPQDWSLTSDSLALWLAGQLGAERCYLIKSFPRRYRQVGARQLSRDGVVDDAFPAMLEGVGVPTVLLGSGDQASFVGALNNGGSCGAAIDFG